MSLAIVNKQVATVVKTVKKIHIPYDLLMKALRHVVEDHNVSEDAIAFHELEANNWPDDDRDLRLSIYEKGRLQEVPQGVGFALSWDEIKP